MTNTNERATAQVLSTSEHGTAQAFGLSLMAIFVGLLILNGISFWSEPGRQPPMPVLAFFAVVGSVLVALLFAADATLENSSPVIVTSQRTGLPLPRYHNAIKTLTTAPAPAPDMTSQAVLDAQPKSVPEALAKIEPAAREARAEAPRKKARAEAQPQNNSFTQPNDYQQSQFDRFSIKGY